MRMFNVFGVCGEGRAVAAQELHAASPADACALAEQMFPDCALVEVWEEAVLITRIRRSGES
ncbi:hypothetical protein LJR219_003973 [Phenylobacterium sp. LjRoot219]|uniref:hypothetical protein n=1 Tax=Phenylobacterium sp. LjRoot219 TaxID=3342283 RepID=UPI003ECF5BF1